MRYEYRSIIAEGLTIDELERNLNKRMDDYSPLVYKISSPSMFNADGKWVAICIVEPKF